MARTQWQPGYQTYKKKKTKKTGVALQESVANTMEALYTHFRAGGL